MLVFPVHLFQQVRGAYVLGPAVALVMTLAILVMATVALMLWIVRAAGPGHGALRRQSIAMTQP
ncbi:MAG: hypothetical protein IIZ30_04255 [Sphingomonas sp.]|uniref:hypothetical protein n=1 Tax=Sphingomonas sp. TaxID=28214 RepID=UPI00257D3C9B|nr:hypothetical protein [Sphingomonas sp.]MBQ1479231.1 hypothetical protein [Sphingomonas sp.]